MPLKKTETTAKNKITTGSYAPGKNHLIRTSTKELLLQALTHLRSGDLSSAKSLYQIILEKDPDNVEANHLLGVVSYQVGENDTAVKLIRKAVSIQPECANAHMDLGIIFEKLGRPVEAVESYKKVLQINPKDVRAFLNIGNVFMRLAHFDKAIVNYRQALAIHPEYVEAYSNLGNALEKKGELETALAYYKKALSITPNFVDAFNGMGIVLKKLKRFDDAISYFNKALAIQPNFFEALYNLGKTYMKTGKTKTAMDCYKKVLQIRPDSDEALNNLGVAFLKEGQLDEAVNYFEKAISAKENNTIGNELDSVDLYFNLGNTYTRMGLKEKAFSACHRGLLLKTDFPKELIELGQDLNNGVCVDEVLIAPQVLKTDIGTKGLKNLSSPVREEDTWIKSLYENHYKSLKKRPVQKYNIRENLKLFSVKKDMDKETNRLRIVLIQPPVWKIAQRGQNKFPPELGGPPTQDTHQDINADAKMASYGLLSVASQILKSGREVLVLNLTNFSWSDVEKLISFIQVDLVGITCQTYNLRGVKAISDLIKTHHPQSRIVLGGPHPTALPKATLMHFKSVDTLVLGEGEQTFMDIITHMEMAKPIQGLPGTAWRGDGNDIRFGEQRNRIKKIDDIASPHEYFDLNFILTSRGCPYHCTFCGSHSMWGSKVSMNSNEYVLDLLEELVIHRGMTSLAIKDETFTASKKRVLTICNGIIERGIHFIWSCDTRVDVLDEQILSAMRMAGCHRISLGVESGSMEILKNIKKKIVPQKVIEACKMSRKFGLQVRFYMIAGNRGETIETFEESVKLVQTACPNEIIFSYLQVYPGTDEFKIFKETTNASDNIFYKKDYSLFDYGMSDYVSESTAENIKLWVDCYTQTRDMTYYSIDEYQEILNRVKGLHSAHMDLAGAYLREGLPDEAEYHVKEAIQKGYPLMGYVFNYLACIAAFKGDLSMMAICLEYAVNISQEDIVSDNYKRHQKWLKTDGPEKGLDLRLIINSNFPQTSILTQPNFPGPIDLAYKSYLQSDQL
ncbi:MAG: tetratricopeptide repeat protein [Desulfobacteraceae bacterium]|nr:tetratricopeptide repeat protein [Desulfobacteraceae bacterium]